MFAATGTFTHTAHTGRWTISFAGFISFLFFFLLNMRRRPGSTKSMRCDAAVNWLHTPACALNAKVLAQWMPTLLFGIVFFLFLCSILYGSAVDVVGACTSPSKSPTNLESTSALLCNLGENSFVGYCVRYHRLLLLLFLLMVERRSSFEWICNGTRVLYSTHYESLVLLLLHCALHYILHMTVLSTHGNDTSVLHSNFVGRRQDKPMKRECTRSFAVSMHTQTHTSARTQRTAHTYHTFDYEMRHLWEDENRFQIVKFFFISFECKVGRRSTINGM